MDAAIVIALIALAGSILTALLTTIGAPALQGRREARMLVDTYRQPLLGAAFDLQSRVYNMLRGNFTAKFLNAEEIDRREAAMSSTLYVFAQYFAWTEIIRREVQFLRFSSTRDTQVIGGLLRDISEVFLTDAYGPQVMIWRVEQRAIGERMITMVDGRQTSMGYAQFLESRDSISPWIDKLDADLRTLDEGGRTRLVEVQHLLLRLIRQLDPGQLRFPGDLKEA